MVIISVDQGYKSIEGQHDYKTGTETTYRNIGQEQIRYKKRTGPNEFREFTGINSTFYTLI